MLKTLKKFLPLIVGVLVLVLLLGARAWRLSLIPKDGRWPNIEGGFYSTPVMKDWTNYFVPPDEVYENGVGKDGIPALNEPEYIGVAEADDVLADEVEGIDVEVNGKHRFYSFQILNWHELVNDRFGDKELLISYSPLCGSAVVYDRTTEGGVKKFGDSGFVYNNCAVLYAEGSDMLWDQATGKLIAGNDTQMTIGRYPSTVMSWAEWKDAYPNGEALSTETGYTRDYRRHPYGNYDNNDTLFFPMNKVDTRLDVKEKVMDLVFGETHVGATAKFLNFVKEPNYTAGDVSYVAFVDEDDMVHVFNRTVDGQVLTFVHENNEIKDKETDSRWNTDGEAIKGTLRGKKMTEIVPTARFFASAYVSHFPDALLLGNELFEATENKPEGETINVSE